MKRYVARAIVVALLATAPSYAAKVYIDYDDNYSKKVKSFKWVQPEEFEEDPLMHQRVVNAIKHYLTDRGLTEVESDPDIYITYHSDSKEQVNINTSHFGYGYPSGWYGGYHGGYHGGMGSSTTTVSTWTIGTLIIDAWDAETEKLIWRGMAEETVSKNPQKNEKKINKAVDKLFKKWDKIKKKNAKKKK